MQRAILSILVLSMAAAAGPASPPVPRSASPKGKDARPEANRPAKRFTVGKETTYITGPLDKDGYIDYAAALNKRLSKGVTPANNANVLIWKALGPHPQGATIPGEYFEWLGVPQPPASGNYFLPPDRFIKERLKLKPGKATDEFNAQLNRAGQRPWTATGYPALASWLKANEKPMAVIVQATKRSHYFCPLTPPRTKQGPSGLINALLPSVQGCRELANALVVRAMLRLGQGDTEGAWQDLLACHRLGRLGSV